MTIVLHPHVAVTPGVCGGRPCIAGHRIRIIDIAVWHELRGYAADELVAMFPGLTLADVYAALAYYCDHREELDRDLAQDEEAVAGLLARHPSKVREPIGG